MLVVSPGWDTTRNAKSSSGFCDEAQDRSTNTWVTVQAPNGCWPRWYSGTKSTLPRRQPCMQCAAVMTRSPAGLSTTLPLQKCWPRWPEPVLNRAPTAGVPV